MLFSQFIENMNDYFCRVTYIMFLKLSSEPIYPPGFQKLPLVINTEDDFRLSGIVAKLLPYLNKNQCNWSV